jgi:hypothetical protein
MQTRGGLDTVNCLPGIDMVEHHMGGGGQSVIEEALGDDLDLLAVLFIVL